MINQLFPIFAVFLFAFGCFTWYIMHGLEGYMNGFRYTNQFLMPFQFWYSNFELLWEENRAKFIYQTTHNLKSGYISDYRVEDIIKKELYMEVGNKVLPGIRHFIILNLIPFLPLIIHLMIWCSL